MTIRRGHNFPKSCGFTASAGMVPVRAHFRKGGQVKATKESAVLNNSYRANETSDKATT